MPNSSESEHVELVAVMRRFDRNSHGHILQALRLKALDDLATSVTVIGGVAVLALSSSALGEVLTGRWVALVLAIVSGVATLVGVLQAVWKPGERAARHRIWAGRFAALENDCRLALDGKGAKTLEQILADQNMLADQVDLVPEWLWKRARRNREQAGR